MIKNFSLFKVTDKKNDKAPDYKLSVQVGDKYEEVGAGWIKEGQKGKFISVKMSDERSWEYKGKTITRSGWHLEKDKTEVPVLEYPEEECRNRLYDEDDINPDSMSRSRSGSF